MNFYLATSNRHKADELSRLLADHGLTRIVLQTADEAGGMPDVEETADSFSGNARLKARALWERIGGGAWVLADDSGLEVDALGGAPGLRSARYAGEGASDAENNRKLLRELENMAPASRSARFRCCLVLISPEGTEEQFEGVCEGHIAPAPAGDDGFGYDPLFIPEGYRQTFAQLGADGKDRISHRGRAWETLARHLARDGVS